jgi:hypothetical protein
MLTYDFLKEDPSRDKLIKGSWVKLFNREDVPYSVMCELKELTKAGYMCDDATLFWNKVAIEILINGEVTGSNAFMSKLCKPVMFDACHIYGNNLYNNRIATLLYSVVQKHDFNPNAITMAVKCLQYWRDKFKEYERMPIVEATVNGLIRYKAVPQNVDKDLVHGILLLVGILHWNHEQIAQFGPYLTHLKQTASLILPRCTLRMVQKLSSRDQINKVHDLLYDTELEVGAKFNSINELQREHDRQAQEKRLNKLGDKVDKKYKYDEHFKQIVEANGFFLPESPIAISDRGEEHQNCLANYIDHHAADDGEMVTRLVFNKVASAALILERRKDRVVTVGVSQYKRAYNHDMDWDELTDLRIALTGLMWEQLKVRLIPK